MEVQIEAEGRGRAEWPKAVQCSRRGNEYEVEQSGHIKQERYRAEWQERKSVNIARKEKVSRVEFNWAIRAIPIRANWVNYTNVGYCNVHLELITKCNPKFSSIEILCICYLYFGSKSRSQLTLVQHVS